MTDSHEALSPEERATLAFQKVYSLSTEDLRNGLKELKPLVEGEVFVARFADSGGWWADVTLVLLDEDHVVASSYDEESGEIVAAKVVA